MGAASAAAAAAVGPLAIAPILAVGLAGAALTATVRALAGDSPASLTGAVLAPLLLIAQLFDPAYAHGLDLIRACVSIAALGWTVVELARPSTSPLVALLPAVVAAILSPGNVALVAVAGARAITSPWERPRWAFALPVLGALAILIAVLSGIAHDGMLRALGDRWAGAAAHRCSPATLLELAAATLGPITAVAALAGLPWLCRARHGEIALGAAGLGAVLLGLRSGVVAPELVALAALSTGLAIGRFAGLVRMSSAQAILGATASLLVVLPPAWTVVEHGTRPPIHAPR